MQFPRFKLRTLLLLVASIALLLSITIEHRIPQGEYSVVSPSKEFVFTTSIVRYRTLLTNRIEVQGVFYRNSDKAILFETYHRKFGPAYTYGDLPICLADSSDQLPVWSKDSRHVKYWITKYDFRIKGIEKTKRGYSALGDYGINFEPVE